MQTTTPMPAMVRAAFKPATYDDAERTVELTWTTGSRVRRVDWVSGREFDEELEVSTRALDLSRLNAGAPLLDTHDQFSLDSVLGVVERAWVEGEEGRALVRFSARADAFAQDVRAGIIRNVSVGYTVQEWEEVPATRGAVPIRRAIRWQPHELSLVPVPADAAAQVRGADPRLPAPASPAAPPASSQETTMDDHPIETRAAEASAPAPAQTAERAASRPSLADYERIAATTRGVLDAAWAAEQYRAGTPLDGARDMAIDAIAARLSQPAAPAPSGIVVGRSGDDPAEIRAAMADALAVGAMGRQYTPATDRFRDYVAMRPSDMLMELASARGERVSPRDRLRLIERAFHTSSDFPLLLELSANKMLEAGYALANPSFRAWMAQKNFNDFKAHKFLTAGDFPALAEIGEAGEITAGTVSEKREQITPKTYARGLSVTRQMLINDEIGAFTDFASMIGRRVADFENATAYAVVNTASGDGPTLAEGSAAVFGTGAGRLNKASEASTVTAKALGLGFNAIAAQTSLDGLKLNLSPRYLVCSRIQEFVAAQFAESVPAAGSASNINVFAGRFQVIADSNIPSNRWYLFADPAAAPVYVYGYVNGATAPSIRVFNPQRGVDGITIEVVHDFAVGAIDYRGGYFNSGVAPT